MAKQKEPSKTPENFDLSQVPLVVPEDGMFEAYANVVNLNWTLSDVRIRFAELTQQVKDGSAGTWKDQEAVIMERVAVTIPWQQAKSLHQMLGNLIAQYEKVNGELKPITLPVV